MHSIHAGSIRRELGVGGEGPMRVSAALLVVGLSVSCAANAIAQRASSVCPAVAAGEAKPWLNASYTPECRAHFVLEQLRTLDDKFALLAGNGALGSQPNNAMYSAS